MTKTIYSITTLIVVCCMSMSGCSKKAKSVETSTETTTKITTETTTKITTETTTEITTENTTETTTETTTEVTTETKSLEKVSSFDELAQIVFGPEDTWKGEKLGFSVMRDGENDVSFCMVQFFTPEEGKEYEAIDYFANEAAKQGINTNAIVGYTNWIAFDTERGYHPMYFIGDHDVRELFENSPIKKKYYDVMEKALDEDSGVVWANFDISSYENLILLMDWWTE